MWIGNKDIAKDERFLHAARMTHVVNASQHPSLGGLNNYFEATKVGGRGASGGMYNIKLEYLRVPVQDCVDENISRFFESTCAFIRNVKKMKGRLLVHCNKGRSRSVSLVIAYLMHDMKMTYDEAYAFVSERREEAEPNSAFVQQLKEFERICREVRT